MEPGGGGGMLLAGFPQKGDLVLCRDSTPIMDLNLFHRSSDLVDCFDILCDIGGDDVSSRCVPPGFFYRDLLQSSLSDVRVLDVTCVPGTGLLCEGDWVCFSVQAS